MLFPLLWLISSFGCLLMPELCAKLFLQPVFVVINKVVVKVVKLVINFLFGVVFLNVFFSSSDGHTLGLAPDHCTSRV